LKINRLRPCRDNLLTLHN